MLVRRVAAFCDDAFPSFAAGALPRFRVVERSNPARFKGFLKDAQEAARQRYAMYRQLAGITLPPREAAADEEVSPIAPHREEAQ